MRKDTLIVTLAVTLALVGCGGASGASSTPQASAAPSTTSPTSATSAAASSPTATAGTEIGTATIPASSVTTARASNTTNTAPRLPARFTVGAGGRLSPTVVAAPAHIDIEVSIRCTDRHVHRVVLATPHRHTFKVSRSSAADVLLIGLHNGTYAINVDGKRRGKLIVGAIPGP
jgi:hypothetical protein